MKKTLKSFKKSNTDLNCYLVFPCEISEQLFNYIAETSAPHFIIENIIQSGEAEFVKDNIEFFMTISFHDNRYFYLGILPDMRR